MKQRCYSERHDNYRFYGARGIKVCESWLNSFEAFYEDMGVRPDGHTIDRIDPDGNYEPNNCRWADSRTQALNRRSCNPIEISGEILTLREAGIKYGIPTTTIYRRYKQGYRGEELIDRNTKLLLRTGEKQASSKLTWDDVDQIRNMAKEGNTQADIARCFKISQSVVSEIVNNKAWTKR